jgi:hypothetical protein
MALRISSVLSKQLALKMDGNGELFTEMKVPGRKNMVTMAMLLMTLLSCAAASVRVADCSEIVMLVLLSFCAIKFATWLPSASHYQSNLMRPYHRKLNLDSLTQDPDLRESVPLKTQTEAQQIMDFLILLDI